MSDSQSKKYDLFIIGAGVAGMAATLFAANRGLSCAQVGLTGEINFASGFLDLLGVHPVAEKKVLSDPWAGIDSLVHDIPNHPYARLPKEDVQAAFEELLTFLKEFGLTYHRRMNRNSAVLTSLGTTKPTYGVPHTMWHGVAALEKKLSCLLIDIRGLKGFSVRQIAAALQGDWPDLTTGRISFPGMDHLNEVYPEHMANALELQENRAKLAEAVRPHINDAKIVGFPAILGIYRTHEVLSDFEDLLGMPIFEIPTIPPSVPGIRLRETFEKGLRAKGVEYFSQNRVLDVRAVDDRHFELDIGRKAVDDCIQARGIILASGRFIGGGLYADRQRVKETIFDLPVHQPDTRAEWHRRNMLDANGHPVNRAGLEIDDAFRPLNRSRRPAFRTLFAAGSILAHNDWKRLKCGAGLAIATAFGAVKSFVRINK
jgi:glycerol-3-phosphate dehydrogenase subunit B